MSAIGTISEPKQGAGNTLSALTNLLANKEQSVMAAAKVVAPSRTVNRFQEEIVWATGLYRVDELGRIWRGDRRAENRTAGGYLQVKVMRNRIRYYTCAHRLVWRALFGPIPEGMVINHKNGRKDDNRPENLEIVSYSENTKHAYRHGLMDEHGESNPAAKLTDNQVAQIRNMYAQGGYTMAQLGELFGVRFQHISRLIHGQRRRKQGGPTSDADLRVREMPEVRNA